MKRYFFLMLAMAAMTVQAKNYAYTTVPNDPLKARIYTLDNGLTVYLTQNAEKPEIQTFIAVRAGAQNDPLNSTGLAHYQEHIMFKGTKSYGTTNYEKEKPNLDAIDSLYEVYGHTTDEAARKAIYHQIDSFSYEGSKIAIANEFDKLMSMIGATGVNAFTSTAMTCYHEIIPAGELRRWAMIESDRFQNLIVRGFHTELETVYEEFNMYSTMDQMKVQLAVDQILFPNVPYRQHTVLGTQEHLKNPSLKNIKNFYQTYYRPNNVAICLSGDIDFDATIALIDEYFGAWKANANIPAFDVPEQKDLTAPKDTTVFGKEAPEVWIGWKMPGVKHEDIDAVEIMSSVLNNGKCGLIDLDIDQKQLLLGAAAFPDESNDYSTFFLVGVPKEGQDLTEVKRILLDEVEKLKRGEFSEEMLKAIIANERRYEMQNLQSNRSRVNKFLSSFIYQIPYGDIVSQLDRYAKITKDDVVRVANKYLTTNSYACVYKRQGDNANPTKVEKPAITPIEMNRELQSDFVRDLGKMQAERLQPQYLDFDKDLSKTTLAKGQQLLYVQNKENELFNLSFVVGKGSNADPAIGLALDLMSYLGTDKMTADEKNTRLYNLAAEMSVSNNGDETYFSISGLQENFDATLALLEDWVMNVKADDAILKEVVKDNVKGHNDAKLDQGSNFSQLRSAGMVGLDVRKSLILTPKQMKKMKAADLMQRIQNLLPGIIRVTYYGPATEADIVKTLNGESKFIAMGDPAKQTVSPRIHKQVIAKNEVWLAPYKANNIYFFGYSNMGELYTPKDEAIAMLFNEYFDGSMGSIVFQEMRESRALCYASSANYDLSSYKGENNIFYTYIISQNDKLKDCMEAFDSICNYMPLSPSAFDQAKTSLLKQIEQRRYVRSAPIGSYIAMVKNGWDHDYYKEIYEEVQRLTLDDVVAFQKARVANRTYRYLVLGNKKDLDMKYLKSRGKVKKLSTKDIFVY